MQSVVKTFAVIDALVERGEATAAELAELVDEPRSSVYRMLRTLQGLELVEAGSRRGVFRPGVGLVRLGGSVLTRFDERTVTLPILERLRAQTKETVHLSVRRGYQAVFIERLLGERAHFLAIPLGGTLPLHVGAAPRVLLACEPRSFWDEYFAATTVEQWTHRSPADEPAVRALLEETLETGVSISDEDVVLGVATVAAPISRPPRQGPRGDRVQPAAGRTARRPGRLGGARALGRHRREPRLRLRAASRPPTVSSTR